MPIDPYFVRRFAAVAGFDRARGALTDPDTIARLAAFAADDEPWADPPADELAVENLLVPGRHGDIPLRRYRPRSIDPDALPLVWAHGGGFAAGTLDWPEAHVVSASLALLARTEVLSVDYRLAAEGTRYPVPLDDVHDAVRWAAVRWAVAQWADAGWAGSGDAPSGGAPDARGRAGDAGAGAGAGASAGAGGSGADAAGPRYAIGGASAGAALALAVAARLRDEGAAPPEALLLAYPFAHFPVPPLDDATAAEMRALPPMARFFPADVERMVRGYVGRISGIPAEALPGALPLGGLPATSIVLAEYDELRPSGELLARQLEESGVAVRTELATGVPHGHLNRLPGAPRVSSSLRFFAEALTRASGSTP